MRHQKILNSILLKPAGPDCNMNCQYCFYLKKSSLFKQKIPRMSEKILHESIRQVMDGGNQVVNFSWQGGEPTLLGIPFFELAVSYQQQYRRQGQIVINGLQTNGLLIDHEWAKFLSDAKFLVGLSIDGPQHIHDRYRKLKGGGPSWEKVCRAGDILMENNVDVNVLSVVNDHSVQFPEEIYDFHKSNNLIHMQFIPCLEFETQDRNHAAPFSVKSGDYGKFLCRLFDHWLADFKNGRPTTFIGLFDSVLHTYIGELPPECTLLEQCGLYVVVEHNGNVYSCDFFVNEDNYLGNIRDDFLQDLLNSEKQAIFGEAKGKLPAECLTCPWLSHCFGGCPKDRIAIPTGHTAPYFCKSFKMFFEHSDSTLKTMADRWIKANNQSE